MCLNQNLKNIYSSQNRYPNELKNFYLYYATFGEDIYNHFVENFGFPSFRTVQRYKSNILLESQISSSLLDGSEEHINKILTICWDFDPLLDKRCVIAVDAASVTASISICKNGQANGLTYEYTIEDGMEEALSQGLDAFIEFVNVNKDDLCKYYFICYINPLSPKRKPFPVLISKASHGQVTEEIMNNIDMMIIKFMDLYSDIITIIGMAFDGDPGWLQRLKYVLDFIPTHITDLQQIDFPLAKLLENFTGLLPFEDSLHLLKCARYRIVKHQTFYPWPSDQELSINAENLKIIGIPDYVLDSSQSKKMEDIYPLMMFNFKILGNIARLMPQLFPIFAPLTLFEESIFNNNLTREKRLAYLSHAFCLMWFYRFEVEQSKVKKKYCIFDKAFIDKFQSLCITLSTVISCPQPVHLGALGTHWLEHYFGKIRRLCKGNDSAQKIEEAITFTLLQKYLMNKKNSDYKSSPRKKRISDSGCILPEENEIMEPPTLMESMIISHLILAKAKINVRSNLNDLFINTQIEEINDSLDEYPESFIDHLFHSTSTLRMKMQGGGGFTSRSRMLSGNELLLFSQRSENI